MDRHDEKQVCNYSTGKVELQTASPLVSLVSFGRTAEALELWREDGADRGVLMRLVVTAVIGNQADTAVCFASMLTETERFFVGRMAHKVDNPDWLYDVLKTAAAKK